MKKNSPVVFALLILVVASYLIYQAVYSPIIVSFAPSKQPAATLWPGIQQLSDIGGNTKLLWSPTQPIIAGSITTIPSCPDWWCAFGDRQSEIFIVDLESQTRKTIYKTDQGSVAAVGWSSDGKKVLFTPEWGDLEPGIWAVDIQGETSPELIAEHPFTSWSPDGSKLAFVGSIGKPGESYRVINVLDLRTKKEEQIFKGEEALSYILSLSWSFDSRQLAFSYSKIGSDVPSDLKPSIYLYQLEDGSVVQLTEDGIEYGDAIFSPTDNLIALEPEEGIYGRVVIRDLTNNCQVILPVEEVSSLGSWSPDGTKFIFSTFGDYDYIVDLREFLGFDFQKENSLCP